MIILGIDPGTNNLGYSILKFKNSKYSIIEAGVLKITSNILQTSLLELSEGLDKILNNYKIDEVSIENIFFAHNPKTIIKLAHFRGAICLKIMLSIGKYSEYSPLEVKKAVTGNGKSTKEQVSFMVRKILGITKEIKPYDITDAIAIAISHAQRLKYDNKVI